MTSWSSSIKICFYELIESIIKKMSWCETECKKKCKKNVLLVKQNVMKLEVFILGRQRIDQKEGMGEREREETKGN